MQAERRRLQRLGRLERVRAVAKNRAAAEAAAAEGNLARLDALDLRTRALHADYGRRAAPVDALELGHRLRFVAGLEGVALATRRDAQAARTTADRLQQELALAERRRAAVEDRASRAREALARREDAPVLTARRASGTPLE